MSEKYIFLVEDNPDDVALTRIAFRKCGIPVQLIVVNDGQEALDFLFGEGKHAGRDTAETPSVTLLDLKIPYMGGLEVLKHIREDQKTAVSR